MGRDMGITGWGGASEGREQIAGPWNVRVLLYLVAWEMNGTFSLGTSNRLWIINMGRDPNFDFYLKA